VQHFFFIALVAANSSFALCATEDRQQPGPVPTSLRIEALQARIIAEKGAGDTGAVEQFWKNVGPTPIVEDIPNYPDRKLITFVWRGDASTKHVVVMSELGGYTNFEDNLMKKVIGHDIYFKSYVVRDDARFTYFLAPNDSMMPLGMDPADMGRRIGAWRTDPLNPKQTPVPGRMASYVEMPNAPQQPHVVRREGVPRGNVELHQFRSDILVNDRRLSIYTPPGYSTEGERYPLLIMLDGVFYTFFVPTPVILDNMIAAGEIAAPVLVVVDTLAEREKELSCNPSFAGMIANELLPWIRARYHVTEQAQDVVLGGSSLAGLAAACAALRRPDAIGGVISQSGSFWWANEGEPHEWVRRQVEGDVTKKPVRFYLDVGLMELGPVPGDGPDMVTVNRRLLGALRLKGYDVTFREFNGGHEFLNWRGTLSEALRAHFSR
jgi:enterochelin esterase-like enzyme